MDKIDRIIDETPYISQLYRDFLKTMIRQRKEKIIDKAMERSGPDERKGKGIQRTEEGDRI